MCHLILLVPLAMLPIFWLAPLSTAIPVYLIVILIFGAVYWLIMKSMIKPPWDDFHSLVGTRAEVVGQLPNTHAAQYLVRSRGELWSAYTEEAFTPGDRATIVGVRGIGVVVERPQDRTAQNQSGGSYGQRNCH